MNKNPNLSLSANDFLSLSPEKQARFLDLTKELAKSAIERMKAELNKQGIQYTENDIEEIQKHYDKLLGRV